MQNIDISLAKCFFLALYFVFPIFFVSLAPACTKLFVWLFHKAMGKFMRGISLKHAWFLFWIVLIIYGFVGVILKAPVLISVCYAISFSAFAFFGDLCYQFFGIKRHRKFLSSLGANYSLTMDLKVKM